MTDLYLFTWISQSTISNYIKKTSILLLVFLGIILNLQATSDPEKPLWHPDNLLSESSSIAFVVLPQIPAQCTDSAPTQLLGDPVGAYYSGPGVSSTGLFDPGNANIGNNQIFFNPPGPNNTKSINIKVAQCEPVFSGFILNDCGSDRSFETYMQGMDDVDRDDPVCMTVPSTGNVTRVAVEIWVEVGSCQQGVPDYVTFDFGGDLVSVQKILAVQSADIGEREYFYRYVYEGNPSSICVSDKSFCKPTSMAIFVERDVEDATSSITTYDFELHDDKTPAGQDDCILDSLYLGMNDVDRNITISVPIHEKDNSRAVTVLVNIKTNGSDDILATNMMTFTEQNRDAEAALYTITLENVPGGGDLAEITVCSPDPNGDSFGVGSIIASTNEVCITCVLDGKMTDDEICNGEEATISANYTSTSYEANDDNGDEMQVYYEWETGETTSSIDVSPSETTSYSCTITDELGCEIIELATVIVNDVTVEFFGNEDFCLDADDQTGLGGATPEGGVYSGPGVTDDGNGATYTFSPSDAGVGEHWITYDYTDENGCSGNPDIAITVNPSISLTTDAACNAELTIDIDLTVQGGTADFTYEWTGPNSFTSSEEDLFDLEPGTYFVTVTDANGCTQTANETQTACCLPPTLACPSDMTIQCDESDDPLNTGTPTTGEGCGVITVSYEDSDEPGNCSNETIITRTWTATDEDNNTLSCDQIITIVDTEGPEFETPPADVTVQCLDDIPTPDDLEWTDNCDGDGSVSPEDESNGETCPEVITRTWSYTDDCGNPGFVSQMITIDDNIKPEISSNDGDDDFGCNPTIIPPSFTAQDNCLDVTVEPTVSSTGPEAAADCGWTQTWTANYTDACDNAATAMSITYTWTEDEESPVITSPNSDSDLGCNPSSITTPTFEVNDNCLDEAITLTPSTSGPEETESCGWTQTWTADYEDACLNEAAQVSVTYTWTEDTEVPVITTNNVDGDLGCNPVVEDPIFIVIDNCLDVTVDAIVTIAEPIADGCIMTKSWTATYTDACLNEAVPVTITYTWTVDTEKPVITTDATSQDLGCNPIVTPPTFIANDNCMDVTVEPTVTSNGPEATAECGFTQTWTANYKDACLNEATPYEITYTWTEDTEKPVISANAVSGDLGCNPTVEAPIFTVNDNCIDIADLTISSVTDGEMSNGCAMSQTWTANYMDACGNIADEKSVTFTWSADTESPVITTEANSGDLGCNPDFMAPTFKVSDNCLDMTLNVDPTTDGPQATANCGFTQTWTANYGNTCDTPADPVSITYTWTEDTEVPVITTNNVDGDLGCNPVVEDPIFVVNDNCLDITVDAIVTIAEPIATGCIMTKSWTATYTDACVNEALPVTVTYTWTVDTEKPEITTDATSQDLGCNPIVNPPTFIANDNCMDVTVEPIITVDGPTETENCGFTQTWTANYTDACENIADSKSITYTWTEDTEKPVISANAISGDLGCNPTVEAPIFTVNDNCIDIADLTISAVTDGEMSNGCAMSQTWTANYKDACGNIADEVSVTFTWSADTESPVITTDAVSGDLGCNPNVVPPTFSVSDNCLDMTLNVDPTTDGPQATANCGFTQTWTANYGNTCDTPADPVSITYTWTEDTEVPVITTNNVDGDLGCNPIVEDPIFVVNDNCLDITVDAVVTTAEPIADGCIMTKSWTATYTDACLNEALPVTVTYTWTVDTEKPVITTDDESKDLGCNPIVTPPTFIANDNCMDVTVAPLITVDGPTETENCGFTQTWTANYTDACENIADSKSITYTWTEDSEAPVISTTVVDKDLGCNPTEIVFDTPEFDGSCDPDANVTVTPTTGDVIIDGCNRSQTRTWKAIDCSGLETEISQTLTWIIDDTAPIVIKGLEDKDLGCNPLEIVFDIPEFDGECSPAEAVQDSPSLGEIVEDGCSRSQTQTWTVTDCSLLETTITQTITWTEDTEAPIITTAVEDRDLGYNPTEVIFDQPVFDGECSPAENTPGFPETGEIVIDGCDMSQTKTWKVIDCSGLETETSQTLTWKMDGEAPEVTVDVSDKALGCNPDEIEFDEPEFDGGCSDVTISEGYPIIGEIEIDGCDRTQTKTWQVTDESQLTTTVTQTLSWIVDTEAPQLLVALEPLLLPCNPAVITFSEPEFDGGCSEVVNVEGYPILGQILEDDCNRSQTKTWQVTDCSGEILEVSQTASWSEDKEDPTITFVNPMLVGLENGDVIQIQCYGQNPNWQLPEASVNDVTVEDNCLAEVEVTVEEIKIGDGNCAEDGYIQRLRCSWTATDACGNSAELFIFMEIVDTIAPVFTNVPANVTVGCNDEVIPPTVTAVDECLCADVVMEEEIITADCAEDRKILRTWTASDCCGNESTYTQTISYSDEIETVLEISLPGGLSITDDLTLEFDCNSGGIPSDYEDLTANDASATETCNGTPEITLVSDVTFDGKCSGGALEVHELVWTASDGCGNSKDITLTIRVIDTVPPVIDGAQDFICGSSGDLPFVFSNDACTGSTMSFYDREVDNACGNVKERVYEAVDECGNFSTFVQTIIFDDITGPKITLTPDALKALNSGDTIEINCGDDFMKFGIDDAIFTDECDRPLETAFDESDEAGLSCENGGNTATKLVWSAEDFCGNLTEFVIYLKRVDNVPPTFAEFNAEYSVSCDRSIPDLEAVDDCSAVQLDVEDEIIPGACPNTFDIKRRISATDACGNTSTVNQLIHVIDQQGPQILGVEPFMCEDTSMPEVTIVDNCGNTNIEVFMVEDTILTDDCAGQYFIRRMWSATDACGNTTELEQMISMQDVTAPELIYNEGFGRFIGNNVVIYMSNASDMAGVNNINFYSVLGREVCSGEIINPEFTENTTKSLDCLSDGFYEKRLYSWEVSDACGNISTLTTNISIIDDIPPSLENVPESANFGCNPIPDLGFLEPPLFSNLVDSMTGNITFTEVMDMGDEEMTITNTWIASDECGNQAAAVQVLAAIINSDLASTITTEEIIRCNSHGNIVLSEVTGGDGPYTYEWDIEGKDCQIQGGQGTESVEIYIGFNTATVSLQVTDANDCITYSEKIIDCVTKGGGAVQGLSIEGISPNPAEFSTEVRILSDVDQTITFQIVNVIGASVVDSKMDVIKGENLLNVDLGDYATGTYFLKITNGESTDLRKFMKIK